MLSTLVEQLFDNIEEPIVVKDIKTDKVLYANHKAKELFGETASDWPRAFKNQEERVILDKYYKCVSTSTEEIRMDIAVDITEQQAWIDQIETAIDIITS